MYCPIHKEERLIKSHWMPLDGLDPKMAKYACQWCVEYWYKAPKGKFKRWNEVEEDLRLALAL